MLVLNIAQIAGFIKVVTFISLNCYMDLSKFIHGYGYLLVFVKIRQIEQQTFKSRYFLFAAKDLFVNHNLYVTGGNILGWDFSSFFAPSFC